MPSSLVLLCFARRVERLAEVARAHTRRNELRIQRIVQLPIQHLLALCSHWGLLAGHVFVRGVRVLGSGVRAPYQSGPVAQLGARLNGIQEVTGSILVRSTNLALIQAKVDLLNELRLASQRAHACATSPSGWAVKEGSSPSRVHFWLRRQCGRVINQRIVVWIGQRRRRIACREGLLDRVVERRLTNSALFFGSVVVLHGSLRMSLSSMQNAGRDQRVASSPTNLLRPPV